MNKKGLTIALKRKLKARQDKLASEVEVKADFTGRILGLEARHEADHVRVDLTLATDGQGSGGVERGKGADEY